MSDVDWSRVFRIRCRSKRGEHIAPDELKMCERALRADPERYSAMNDDVFDATNPNPLATPRRKRP